MKYFFANLKFKYKILIGMISITTLALLLISRFSYRHFLKQNTQEALMKANHSIKIASSTIDNQVNFMLINTARLLLSKPFPDIIYEITNEKGPNYSKYFATTSDAIETFIQNNDLVSGAILYGNDGTFYSEANVGIYKDPQVLFKEDIWDLDNITVLPKRPNLITNIGYTTPIVFPISENGENLTFKPAKQKNPIKFIILLDSDRINMYFSRFSNSYTHTMYLADSTGYPLDITFEEYPVSFLPEMKNLISETQQYGEKQLTVDNDFLYVHVDTLNFCNLKVVHIIKKSSLMADVLSLRKFFILTWLICTLLAAVLCSFLSNFLIRPLQLLTKIIYKINNQDYNNKKNFKYTDEIGILGNQLNKMYDTIQLQMKQIKKEEQKKAKAEIQLLSEQMNPHFLYNTLECIHFQVLNNHNLTASAMLESLGKYLRITLSAGNPMIPIKREIEHVTTYMEIMNRHSSKGINFTCQVDPSLIDYLIIKIILQPLVENSIKHGFDKDVIANSFIKPEISIEIKQENNFIIINVSDNGKGIDIEKAKSCLNISNPDDKWHFALRNIYKRLLSYYGDDASMDFTSIPYFKSSVIIKIPYQLSNYN